MSTQRSSVRQSATTGRLQSRLQINVSGSSRERSETHTGNGADATKPDDVGSNHMFVELRKALEIDAKDTDGVLSAIVSPSLKPVRTSQSWLA